MHRRAKSCSFPDEAPNRHQALQEYFPLLSALIQPPLGQDPPAVQAVSAPIGGLVVLATTGDHLLPAPWVTLPGGGRRSPPAPAFGAGAEGARDPEEGGAPGPPSPGAAAPPFPPAGPSGFPPSPIPRVPLHRLQG
eukprot:6024895-Alexandrium_andersonii.AAC.1